MGKKAVAFRIGRVIDVEAFARKIAFGSVRSRLKRRIVVDAAGS